MAIDMDPRIQVQLMNHPNIRFRRATSRGRWAVRALLKKLPRLNQRATRQSVATWNDFNAYAKDFQNNGFAFIRDFLNENDYKTLKENWPKTRFFAPIGSKEKSKTSDKGLWCSEGKPLFEVEKNQALWNVYQMFISKEFRAEVTKLAGDAIERHPYHMLAQNSYWGSGLAPHRDSRDDEHKSKINFIYFVDANGEGWDSGGTSILRSNTFDEPIFIPDDLNNTCLFYYSESEMFHGFPRLKFGKYRRNIIAHFCAIEPER
jgi:hypothetical protein